MSVGSGGGNVVTRVEVEADGPAALSVERSEPDPKGRWARPEHIAEAGSLLGVLLIAALVRLPTLGQPLAESFGFRQTQTAFSARIFHEQGISLLHPQTPVLGEPWEIPFEFPLFQAFASVPMSFGISPDRSMRLTALACFLLTAVLLWALVRYITRSAAAGIVTAVVFCFSPFALLWSRASLIEFLATAGAVGFALGAVIWLDRRSRLAWVGAVVAGSVALLVKPTTGAFWALPILGAAVDRTHVEAVGGWFDRVWTWIRKILRPGVLVLLFIPFVLGSLWTRHADHIKDASITTDWLTSDALREWNMGTLDQRLVAMNWVTIADRVDQLIVGRFLWVGLIVVALIAVRHRAFWLGIVGAALLPPVIFFNLYVVHDYYLAAITPAVAALLGLVAWWAQREFRSRFGSRFATPVVTVVLCAVWLVPTLWTTSSYWHVAYEVRGPPQLAYELAARTDPDDRVVALGLDWEPSTFYYANRRGTMLAHHLASLEVAEELHQRGYNTFVVSDPFTQPIGLMRAWPWIAPISQQIYRVGDEPPRSDTALVLATQDDDAIAQATRSGAVLSDGPITVPCGGAQLEVPRGAEATWLSFDRPSVDTAIVQTPQAPAALPVTDALVVPKGDGPLTIACYGTDALTLRRVVDAPPPID